MSSRYEGNILDKSLDSLKYWMLLLGWGMSWLAGAQVEQEVLTKNYKFNDGLYYDYIDFKNNQPSIILDQLKGNLFSNPQNFTAKVSFFNHQQKDTLIDIPLDSIWGFSIGGIPYLRLPKKDKDQPLVLFAGLKVRGRLCYFSYEDWQERNVEFSAYNPYTDQPFRTAVEKRKIKVKKEKILLFETGEIRNYDEENLAAVMQDDPVLLRALRQIDPYEREEKQFKCLLIYDDRHPIMINKTIE